jgi:hypothetical protein
MLKDRKRIVERLAANGRLRRQIVQEYGAFLRMLFAIGDWFVTLTFRDCYQDSESNDRAKPTSLPKRLPVSSRSARNSPFTVTRCARDPRIETWQPDSKYRHKPGPPVRDAALREISHWLVELGWEAAGRARQEVFDRLAAGLDKTERRKFAKTVCKRCLCCAVLNDPVTFSFYDEMHAVATSAIGWVIAEDFGRVGGRWHVHMLVRGVQHVRRKKWWRRAFVRFGRNRIEPIHE